MKKGEVTATFGISIEPTWTLSRCTKIAMLAENLGYSSIWVPDGGPAPPYSDSIVTLTAIASCTKKIRLGSAILNFYARNPAMIASSFLALSDLSSFNLDRRVRSAQRTILGIGIGSDYNVSKFGVRNRSSTISDLREAIESIRELLDGKTVTVRTESFAIENVTLSKSKARIPIHVGATGPKALRLAGEIADGIILTDRIASDIGESMKPITLGLAESSRSRRELEITNSVVISVDENARKARNAVRPTCAYLVSWIEDQRALELGFDVSAKEKISKFLASGDETSAAKLVDDKMVSTLTVSGTPSECVEMSQEHLGYNIDHLAFCEPFGPDSVCGIKMIAQKVIPKL